MHGGAVMHGGAARHGGAVERGVDRRWGATLPALLILFTTVWAGCGGAEAGAGGNSNQSAEGPTGTPVEVAVAVRDTVVETVLATGQIESEQAIDVRPEVDGRLTEILAREGTEVARGTPLFRVDDGELRAQVARQSAERDLAFQTLARTRELLERSASSPADLERAEAAARSAQAELDLLELRLERTVVRAPFSGVVGRRMVSLGDYVTPSTPLTSLQTVDPQRAAFSVPERYAERLELGQRVTFRVAAVAGRQFEGIVDFVDPRVELPARTITVKARVPNSERLLRPGMFIEVRLVVEVRPDAVLVPEDAILPLAGANYVWTVEDDEAHRRPVELGVRVAGFVEVLDGVAAGDRVVVGGLERLSPGAQVVPTEIERGS